MLGFIEFDPPTVAALACTAAGLAFAIRGLKRGDHGTPWISSLVWGVLDTLILVGALESAGRANGQLVGGTIGCWILFGYGLKYGPPGWTRHDRLCLLGAGLGLLARWTSGSAAVMVGIALFIVLAGAMPTLASAWKHPDKHNRPAWICFTLAGVPVFLTLPDHRFVTVAPSAVFSLVNLAMLGILFLRAPVRVRRLNAP